MNYNWNIKFQYIALGLKKNPKNSIFNITNPSHIV